MFFSFRRSAAAAVFVNPLDPPPRTAILAPRFRSTRTSRVFPNGWDNDVAKFFPGAIAGRFDQLLAAANAGVQLTHAVVCLSWDIDNLLTDVQRDYLWDAFGVPVFEQILGPGNVLLAHECGAHAGLHITPACDGPMPDIARCACGRSSAPAITVNHGRRLSAPVPASLAQVS
jgi:hypothetical protein